jgi:hypothetical protein
MATEEEGETGVMLEGAAVSEERLRRLFLWALFGTFLLKIVLSFVVPLTNDEAYYYLHAIQPALGYRDHPPMSAWFLYPFLLLGKSEWIVRLPAVLSSTLVGAGIYFLLRGHDEAKARATALLYLVSPLNILFVLYTSDTPLFLFSFLSAAFFYRAVRDDRYLAYVLSGVFLGLAFLSKYFAVFLGATYALHFLISRKDRRRLAGILLLFLSLAPFVAQNVYWNYTHSWANVLFNLYNRHVGERFTIRNVALHAVTQIYLLTPPILYLLYRERNKVADRITGSPLRVFAALFLVPMAIFTALSTVKPIGLHWAISFYPYLFPALFAVSGTERIAGAVRGMGAFTAVHIVILSVLLALPLSAWEHARFYGGLVFYLKGREVAARLAPLEKEYTPSSTSYAQAAILSYYSGNRFIVFGHGSSHGRADDLWTDFRLLDGKNILVFSRKRLDSRKLEPFFESVEPSTLPMYETKFYFALGRGFRYKPYRDLVLKEIRDDFYAIPPKLPTGRDFFRERYFGEAADPGRARK